MLVYLETNSLENNKPYVGKLVDETTFNKYWGSGKYIKDAIKKHGKENFKKVILESGINDHDLLCEREKYWIKFYNSKVPNGYNLTDGGEGLAGWHHSSETKIKMSKSRVGIQYSSETIAKMQAAKIGKIPWNKGKKCKSGWHHSSETKSHLSKVKKGIKFSDEHCLNLSLAHKGKVPWNKGKRLNNH